MSRKPDLSDYVEVKDRIPLFYEDHPDGRIVTDMVHFDPPLIVMKATLYRDHEPGTVPLATGHAYEKEGEGYVNQTSYIENCETSAIGRALADAGYIGGNGDAPRPSREEMEKVARMRGDDGEPKPATDKQLGFIRGLMKDKAIPEEHLERLKSRLDEGMSKEHASKAIEWLQERPDADESPEPGEPLSDKQVVEKARADWITYWESVHGEGTTGERMAWEAERLDPHLLKDEDTPDHSRLDEEDYGMLVEKLADEESQAEMGVGA